MRLETLPLWLTLMAGCQPASVKDDTGTGGDDSADTDTDTDTDSGDTDTDTDSGDTDTDTDTDSGDTDTDTDTDSGDTDTSSVVLTVLINEIVTSNKSTAYDESGAAADWLELYNTGTSSVNLEGWVLSDDPAGTGWAIPAGQTIAAGGYALVWCDKDVDDGPMHADFNLNITGENLTLSDSGGVLADEVAVPELGEDQAYARIPDGSDTWEITDRATPEAANR